MRFGEKKATEKRPGRGDEYHRREERKHWVRQNTIGSLNNWVTGVGVFFSFVAAGGAVGAAIYARGAYTQAKSQAEADWTSAGVAQEQAIIAQQASINQNRAWVNITAKGVALDWSNFNSPNIQTLVTYENMGNSPALNVTVSALFEESSAFLSPEGVRKICATFQSNEMGDTLFMHQPTSAMPSDQTDLTDLKNAQIRVSREDHIHPSLQLAYIPAVVVCVAYRIIGDEHWHYTGRGYDLGVGPWAFGKPLFIPSVGESLGFGQAVLREQYYSDYTD